jgi:hypothetical protein
MDELEYLKKQDEGLADYEALCSQCGECCGALSEDPCSQLIRLEDGRYICKTYSSRLGPQITVSGHVFTCVTIRDVHRHGVSYSSCGYNKAG